MAPFIKHGTGKVLPDAGENRKEATKDWTEDDQAALDQENTQADEEAQR